MRRTKHKPLVASHYLRRSNTGPRPPLKLMSGGSGPNLLLAQANPPQMRLGTWARPSHTQTHSFPCFAHSPPLSHGHPGILGILAPNALGIAVELTAVGWLPSSTTRVPSLDNRRW